jgi:hypothetical protein
MDKKQSNSLTLSTWILYSRLIMIINFQLFLCHLLSTSSTYTWLELHQTQRSTLYRCCVYFTPSQVSLTILNVRLFHTHGSSTSPLESQGINCANFSVNLIFHSREMEIYSKTFIWGGGILAMSFKFDISIDEVLSIKNGNFNFNMK